MLHATFFVTEHGAALGVASRHDLPVEPAAESLAVPGLGWVRRLAELLGAEAEQGLRPLRDATCRSFPVWEIRRGVCERLASLAEDEVGALAEAWLRDPAAVDVDADVWEVECVLGDLKHAVNSGEGRLYCLLEQRAL